MVPSLPSTSVAATSAKEGPRKDAASSSAAATPRESSAGVCPTPAHAFKEVESDLMYFIASPRSVLVGRTRDTNDHVLWLLEQGSFEEALVLAESSAVLPETYESVVQGYIDDLLKREVRSDAVRGEGQ